MRMNQIFNLPHYNIVSSAESRFVLPDCIIGIEVEVEGIFNTNLYQPHRTNPFTIEFMWTPVSDGSLREGGAEFVSNMLYGDTIYTALVALNKYLRKYEPKYNFSHRCSIHIHMDVSDLTTEQLKKLLETYCIFEGPLFHVSGNRTNNEYCLPLFQSKHAVHSFGKVVASVDSMHSLIRGQVVKYTALNILPIPRQGSIEFRHHMGTLDIDLIVDWINRLMCLKKAALDNSIKEEPYLHMSSIGLETYEEIVFGRSLKFDYPNLERDIWRGCRVAQTLANITNLQWGNGDRNVERAYSNIIDLLVRKYKNKAPVVAEQIEPNPYDQIEEGEIYIYWDPDKIYPEDWADTLYGIYDNAVNENTQEIPPPDFLDSRMTYVRKLLSRNISREIAIGFALLIPLTTRAQEIEFERYLCTVFEIPLPPRRRRADDPRDPRPGAVAQPAQDNIEEGGLMYPEMQRLVAEYIAPARYQVVNANTVADTED